MFKKGLAVIACVASVSAVAAWGASSWQLQTKLATVGGTINVRNAATQTAAGLVVYSNFTTSAQVPVTVKPNAGYSITSIKKSGVEQLSAPVSNPLGTLVNVSKAASAQSVVATFTPATYTVTGAVVGAGTITPSATVGYNGTVALSAYPSSGTSILTNVAGATSIKDLNGLAVTLPYAGAVKLYVANVQNPSTVTATYTTVSVSAGANKVAAVGNLVTVRGSVTGGTPAWTQVNGPAVTLTGAATKTMSFTPSAVGTYEFKLSESLRNASDNVIVTVVNSSADYLRSACSGCHAPTGVLPSNAFANWSASTTHKPGGINCISCHTDGPMPTPVNTGMTEQAKAAFCSGCHHTGTAQVVSWNKSSHNIANNGFEEVGCVQCHNPHSTVATATDGKTDSCAACHLDRRGQFPGAKNYSIYTSASMLVLKAPHGGGAPTYSGGSNGAQDNAAAGWATAQPQYLAQGAICTDCHGHNNIINAGYAEGGHGKPSSDVMNAFTHYNWKARQNAFAAGVWGSRQNGNCNRCHTAYGFMKFANQTTGYTRLQLKLGAKDNASTANNVLICIGCHSSVEGPLRINATPSGNNAAGTGAGQALSQGYFALFSSSVANLGAGNTKPQVSFPGYKNSSICVPCHSGRTTDTYVRNNIQRLSDTFKNFSTLQLSNYQHAANMGQTFVGKGAWEFTPGKYAAFATTTPHATIGMDTNQGPCVGCHYSTVTKTLADGSVIDATHSLEINYTSNTCTPCHGAAGAQLAKFEEFSSARFALDQLIRSKFATLWASGSTDLNVERGGFFRYSQFGTTGTATQRAQNGYGATYNWQLVETWDRAAWAHNPAYARQIVFDTLAFLQSDGADLTGNPANVTAALAAAKTAAELNGKTVSIEAAKNFVDGNKDPNALCVGCHAVARDAGAGYVQDNNGVRAITGEFSKWSHHVTGTTLQDAHCAACHLEGKPVAGKIVVDPTKHMADSAIHLRNVDTDADIVWAPEAPNFTQMDNFCLSCHDADGAKSAQSIAIQGIIVPAEGKVASATNPFGDTISNQYDKLERPAVVDAAGQFSTSNPSHHAVMGKKYNGRTRVGSDRAVDSVAFASNSSAALPGVRSTIYDAGKFQADYVTVSDANGTESGLRNGGTTLGDDSTLHCADCHTVGQFAARGTVAFSNMSTNFWNKSGQTAGITRYYKGAIGAHGSANEYMLRNNIGDDSRHQGVETGTANAGVPSLGYGTKPYLVCYNCHAFKTYGSVGAATGIAGTNHAGEYANADRCNGPFNTVFGNMTGEGRLRSISTVQSGAITGSGATLVDNRYGKPYVNRGVGETFGNAFGIQCANCHNNGISAGNIFGGIHGAKDATYTDGMGNTTKHYRFMPGLGNVMFVPGTKGGFTGGTLAAYNSYSANNNGTGTFTTLPKRTLVAGTASATYGAAVSTVKTGSYEYVTGGVSNDLNWEQKTQQPVSGQFDFQAKSMGCYTLGPQGTVKSVGRNGDADKLAAADNLQAALPTREGNTVMFDNWGGCDDHNGAQGAGTGIVRKVLRKVTY